MIYVVQVYKYADAKKVLKGWNKGMPVFVSSAKFFKGKEKVVQEFADQGTALRAIEKIKQTDPWRHYEVVALV